AGNYVIVAKSAINNNATSAVTGDLGLSPAATSYITGFSLTNATGYATSAQVTGKIYAADMAVPTPVNMTTAVNNMVTAYNDAAGRPSPDFLELGTGNIGGKTLVPGLYKWTSNVTMPSNVTIAGGPNDVWIFQISGNVTMSTAVRITLTGGAQPKNIFWQIAGQATLGTTSHFEGIILSKTGITFQTGASINGRALAQTAVILDGNAITKP
ncbi:MAG: ice-binding family protein, partial [Chitinophagaceae bacterium]